MDDEGSSMAERQPTDSTPSLVSTSLFGCAATTFLGDGIWLFVLRHQERGAIDGKRVQRGYISIFILPYAAAMAFPAIKLTYFDFAARGETTRLPLVIGDVPFEDERLQREDWPALKASMPYKKLPVMTVDGHVLCQSLAISRYAGKLAGLYPLDNHVDACRVDEIGDFFEDIVHTIMAVLHETDAVKKETLKTQLKTDKLPEMLTMLEPRVASTSLKGPWFLDKITMADLVIYNLVRSFKTPFFKQLEIPTDISDKYTRLHEIYDAVASHPKVAAWNLAHK